MKLFSRLCLVMVMIFSAIILFSRTAKAAAADGILPELNLSASATIDSYSKYVWRGFTLDSDPVVEPGLSISGYGFTVSFWSNFDASNQDNLDSAEVDLILDYTYSTDYADFSVGHTNYDFPGTHGYSKEWYVGISLSKLPLAPTLYYYHDYGKEENGGGHGDYLNLGISQSFTIIADQGITLDLAASAGYNNKLFINGTGEDCQLTAGLTIPLTKNASFSPKLGYSIPYGDLKSADDGNQKARTFGGVSVAVNF